jgi:hypothetical protein
MIKNGLLPEGAAGRFVWASCRQASMLVPSAAWTSPPSTVMVSPIT